MSDTHKNVNPRGGQAAMRRRFEDKYMTEPMSGCWIWVGTINNKGYGLFRFRGKTTSAHRVSFLLHVGNIPSDIFVCHKCDVPSCVNPEHLFLGTHADNMLDMVRKGRVDRTKKASGERCGQARLTSKQAQEIFSTDLRTTDTKLSVKYGVSRAAIWQIRSGKSWRRATNSQAIVAQGEPK